MTFSTNTAKYLEHGLLIVGLSLIFTFIIVQTAHLAPLILVGVGLVGILVYLGTQIKGAFFLFYFLLGISFLENNEGITPIEIPFYAFSLIMILYVITEVFSGRIILKTLLDKLFLFLLLLLPYAITLGIFNGSSPYTALGEVTNYFGILLYFPLRNYFSEKKFQYILIGIVIVFVTFVLIRNLVNYREIITQAILPWQAEKARSAANEFILFMGCCMTMSAAAVTKSLSKQLIFTLLFLFLLAGLILTQSRGYWIAFFVGALSIFFIIDRRGKLNIFLTFALLSSGIFLVASLFFNDILNLVIKGLIARFETLGSGQLDISLMERLLESKTVLGLIAQNPITGYGMGYMYTKKILFFDHFISTSYVHNGYLAAWFKFGLPGLITIVSIWILNIRYSIKLYYQSNQAIHQMAALTIAGTVFGMLFVNNTSPQVLQFDSILFVTIFSVYLGNELNRNKNP